MSDESDPKEANLVPAGNKALTTRSAALVKRGLETLASLQVCVVHFPLDRSMGRLTLYDLGAGCASGSELGQAYGDIVVPPGKKLCLYINEPILDLSPLSLLRPDDVQGLILLDDKVLEEDYLVHIKHL